jgi:hypothetical protein
LLPDCGYGLWLCLFTLPSNPRSRELLLNHAPIQIDDVQYTPSLDTVKQVFSVYGPLAKMQLLYRAGAWQALVQYAEPAAAAAARSYLNGHAMYPGGANKVRGGSALSCAAQGHWRI